MDRQLVLSKRQAQIVWSRYRITAEEWQDMYDAQDGKCAICGKRQTYRVLSTDHDHRSKEVRGLLCVRCNYALGRFYDDPMLIRSALEYLENFARVSAVKKEVE